VAEVIYAGDAGIFKTCTKCDEIFPIAAFTKSKGAPLDRRTYCRACGEVTRKAWEEKNPNYSSEWYEKNKESAIATSLAWQKANPDKVKVSYRKWFSANKDSEIERNREYRSNNKEKIKQRDAKSRAENPEKRKEYWASWYARFGKERLAKLRQDPRSRLDGAISNGIWRTLNGGKAGRTWESLVGYSLVDLITHLEKLFWPGMTWENYGRNGWEVDHVIPKAFFKYESCDDEDFKHCWALSNLQPLWCADNQSKGARLDWKSAPQPETSILLY
jgi:hypothetical protein